MVWNQRITYLSMNLKKVFFLIYVTDLELEY